MFLFCNQTMTMRQIMLFLLIVSPVMALAQKNAVKLNLSSVAIRNYHVSYERAFGRNMSFNLGVRVMPKGKLPMQETFEDFGGLDDEDLQLGLFEIGNTSITPEVRFYLSKKAMKGFYIAPYARYASFDLSLPFEYTYNDPTFGSHTKTALFTGKITSFSGGLMFGTQFSLAKRLVLDIWWLGGHYGSSDGDLRLNVSIPTTEEQNALRNTLNDFDPSPFEIESEVNASGAVIRSTGPWAGVRALGINLGFRF